jgi:hypothetical protein
MKSDYTYPDSVQEWLDKVYVILEEGRFFEEEQIEPKIGLKSFHRVIGKLAVQSWINNGEVSVSTDEMESAMGTMLIDCHLEKLKEVNLVDCIEDENGDEVFFLTPQGKEIASKFKEHGDVTKI